MPIGFPTDLVHEPTLRFKINLLIQKLVSKTSNLWFVGVSVMENSRPQEQRRSSINLWDNLQQHTISAVERQPVWDRNSVPTALLADLCFRQSVQVEVRLYKEHSFGLCSEENPDPQEEKPWVVALDKTGGRPVQSSIGQFKDIPEHMLQATWEYLTSQLSIPFESGDWYTGIQVILLGELEYNGVFYFSAAHKL